MNVGWFRKHLCPVILALSVIVSVGSASGAGDNLVANGGFEEVDGSAALGWGGLWTREAGAGRLVFDRKVCYGGEFSARIEHSGRGDWSLNSDKRLGVRAGDILEHGTCQA